VSPGKHTAIPRLLRRARFSVPWARIALDAHTLADNSLRSILIVGGGTSGWMAATLLNRYLPAAKCRITLIESADIGIIGVGEATVPPMVGYLRAAKIDEREFMRACHATYKLGIKFADWLRPGAQLWHPFGIIGGSIDRLPLFHHWLRARREGGEPLPYDAYSLQATVGEALKAVRPAGGSTPITAQGAYAYHLDAREFAAFLQGVATRRGVAHVVDNVRGAVLDERGFIAGIETAQHGRLEADLYVDCSGFAGLLIEGALGEPWQSWSEQLYCDRALALPVDYDPRLAPYTLSTALSAGWVWRIPLSHRVGTGYVYASRYIDDDAARREFARHLGREPEAIEPRQLRMRVGRRARFWVRNCVAIGLSAGFLEPLESTALFLVQGGIERLLDLLPDRGFAPQALARYNALMSAAYEEVRDFVVLHYLLNRREDSEFWRANRAAPPPASLARTLELYDATGEVDWDRHFLFGETSFYAIAAGFERLPRRHAPRADYSDAARVREILASIRADHAGLARSLPTHAAYIRDMNAAASAGGNARA
jgi:tryptophan halogenase